MCGEDGLASPRLSLTCVRVALQGFSVGGQTGPDDNSIGSFENKCVRVEGFGESEEGALDGFVVRDMLVQNCG